MEAGGCCSEGVEAVWNFKVKKENNASVAIVVPVYKETQTTDESTALAHLRHYLGAYPCYAAKPNGLANVPDGLEPIDFDDGYFASTLTYNRLLLSIDFYRCFQRYEFILIYQLDCLVLSDGLSVWCRDDIDYIGAPLFNDPTQPEYGFSGLCNGGLSLRRIEKAIEVLSSKRSYCGQVTGGQIRRSTYGTLRDWGKWLLGRSDMQRCRRLYAANEDIFWSQEAPRFEPGFKVAGVADALSFAFECSPRFCFEANRRRLPFGVHAWAKYDRLFWEPYLIQ